MSEAIHRCAWCESHYRPTADDAGLCAMCAKWLPKARELIAQGVRWPLKKREDAP